MHYQVDWLDVGRSLIGLVAVSLAAAETTTTTADVSEEDRTGSHASVSTFYIVRPRLCILCELTVHTISDFVCLLIYLSN